MPQNVTNAVKPATSSEALFDKVAGSSLKTPSVAVSTANAM